MWSWSLYDTRNDPGGGRKPARPWLIRTGPVTTRLPSSSHAWFVDSRTHARTPARQGTPVPAAAVGTAAASAAAGAPAVGDGAAAATPVPNRPATSRVASSTAARRIITPLSSPARPRIG